MPALFSFEGRHVRLLPMDLGHIAGLLAAATADRSAFGFTPVPWDRSSMTAYVEAALDRRESGDQFPFVTWSVDAGRVVGSTRYYELTPWDWSSLYPGSDALQRHGRPDIASIGYTWLEPSVQRTPINTEAKLLMMDHAFEQWGVLAVRLQTDGGHRAPGLFAGRGDPSRAARIGRDRPGHRGLLHAARRMAGAPAAPPRTPRGVTAPAPGREGVPGGDRRVPGRRTIEGCLLDDAPPAVGSPSALFDSPLEPVTPLLLG